MNEGATTYLHISCPAALGPAVEDALTTLGCIACELRKTRTGREVLAYGSSDEELDRWSEALRARFGADTALLRVPLSDGWDRDWTLTLGPLALTPSLRVEVLGQHEHEPGPDTLVLEPALAFGFGEHVTTRLAAEWLERVLARHPGARVLDFGCGTGILGLAALRFGAGAMVGIDIDARVLATASSNARRNGLESRCVYTSDPIDTLSGQFDVIVANIDSRVLVHHAARLVTLMSASAELGMTGLLSERADEVGAAFARHGLRTRIAANNEGWVLLTTGPASG